VIGGEGTYLLPTAVFVSFARDSYSSHHNMATSFDLVRQPNTISS